MVLKQCTAQDFADFDYVNPDYAPLGPLVPWPQHNTAQNQTALEPHSIRTLSSKCTSGLFFLSILHVSLMTWHNETWHNVSALNLTNEPTIA